MARTKDTKSREEAYRIWVREGIHDLDVIAGRPEVNLGRTSLRNYFRGTVLAQANRDFNERCAKAKKLYVENGVTNPEAICAQADIDITLWKRLWRPDWDTERADYIAKHPALYTLGQKLCKGADELINRILATDDYDPELAKQWMQLANQFEGFKTGEYRREMIVSGFHEWAGWFKANANRLGIKPEVVSVLGDAMQEFATELVRKFDEAAK